MIINTSNLGWFHQHPLLEAQFVAMGQMRAAEVKAPLFISANTGVSAMMDTTGRIIVQSASGKPQAISFREETGLLVPEIKDYAHEITFTAF